MPRNEPPDCATDDVISSSRWARRPLPRSASRAAPRSVAWISPVSSTPWALMALYAKDGILDSCYRRFGVAHLMPGSRGLLTAHPASLSWSASGVGRRGRGRGARSLVARDLLRLVACVDELHHEALARGGVHQRHLLAEIELDRRAARELAAGDADLDEVLADRLEDERRLPLREDLLQRELLRLAVDDQRRVAEGDRSRRRRCHDRACGAALRHRRCRRCGRNSGAGA